MGHSPERTKIYRSTTGNASASTPDLSTPPRRKPLLGSNSPFPQIQSGEHEDEVPESISPGREREGRIRSQTVKSGSSSGSRGGLSGGLPMPEDLPRSRLSHMSINSYVHVSVQPEQKEVNKGTFSNTMRKTSQFFKRWGGVKNAEPPVPVIPTEYQQKNSVDITIQRENSVPHSLSANSSAPAGSPLPTTPLAARRRSMSMGSIPPVISPSSSSSSGFGSMHKSLFQKTQEEVGWNISEIDVFTEGTIAPPVPPRTHRLHSNNASPKLGSNSGTGSSSTTRRPSPQTTPKMVSDLLVSQRVETRSKSFSSPNPNQGHTQTNGNGLVRRSSVPTHSPPPASGLVSSSMTSLPPSIRLVSPPNSASKSSLSSMTENPPVPPSPTLDSVSSWTDLPPLLVTQASPTPGSKKAVRASIVGYPTGGYNKNQFAPSNTSIKSSQPTTNSSTTSLSVTAPSTPSNGNETLKLLKLDSHTEMYLKTHSMIEGSLEEKAKFLAEKLWQDEFLERRKVAEWIGGRNSINAATLREYILKFEFSGLRLDMAFRRLCEKLYLKAETQQIDRILEQFSIRFFENNPKGVYDNADVVHAVSYSLLLLNTDLHIVDTLTKMSRPQFVKNTIEAILPLNDSEQGEEVLTPTTGIFKVGTREDDTTINFTSLSNSSNSTSSGMFGNEDAISSRLSLDKDRSGDKRTFGRLGSTTSLSLGVGASPVRSRASSFGMGSERHPHTPSRADLENNLKEMYNAIKLQPIFQSQGGTTPTSTSNSGLGMLNTSFNSWSVARSSSRRSAASSITSGSLSGLSALSGGGSTSPYNKRTSMRGFGSFLGTGGSNSLEIGRSGSPTPSTPTSISASLSEDQRTTSFNLISPATIGFSSSLSHSIIKEQTEDSASIHSTSTTSSTESRELALLGPPWAKEGIVWRKHFWEAKGRRSKEKNWMQVFLVVGRAGIRMFKLDGGMSSMGAAMAGTALGGGDWTAHAPSAGSESLIHAYATPLPPPGYSSTRPNCFVLTLANGGSYFIQAGTKDLVNEWIGTINYWGARRSKEPMVGGVGSMEYGWNRAEEEMEQKEEDTVSVKSGRSTHSKLSRPGFTKTLSKSSHAYAYYPGDKLHIQDWKPPVKSQATSNLNEEQQLAHFRKYLEVLRDEYKEHGRIHPLMIKLYSPKSANLMKACLNWKTKSQYFIEEMSRYTTYIECLESSLRVRQMRRDGRHLERLLDSADLVEVGVDEGGTGIGAVEDTEEDECIIRTSGRPSVSAVSISSINGNLGSAIGHGRESIDTENTQVGLVFPLVMSGNTKTASPETSSLHDEFFEIEEGKDV